MPAAHIRSKLDAPFAFSQSSLQDYADCPRRFQLRYIERLSYPAVESEPALENERRQREGQYFHRLVQQHLIGIPAEQIGKFANTPDLERWWNNYLNSKDLMGLRGLRGLHPEATLSAPLGRFRLIAKYDLIGSSAEKAFIYDWKTYRKRPRNEWLAARWQTLVYPALLLQAGSHLNNGKPFEPEQVEMVYWFADFPSDSAHFSYNPTRFKRDWDALTSLAGESTSASDYPKTDDPLKCSYCPYRSYCDRGQLAGNQEDAESGMEAEYDFDVNFEQIGEIAF